MPTTHSEPVYEVDGVLHYCVANMPGAVPRTSTAALAHAALPSVLALADEGLEAAVDRHPGLERGVNVAAGEIRHPAVAAVAAAAYAGVGSEPSTKRRGKA